MNFSDLGLDKRLVKALTDIGYEEPSPIQAQTIPALLEGAHVIGLAQTGTGKTAAFALPILQQITPRSKTPQALVLAPTRELALQVAEAFETYAAHLSGVHTLPIYGGQAYGVQLSALRRGVQIVVGTPGRIMDHLEKGTLDLTDVRFVVLDEADEMLTMGFEEDVETILAGTPDGTQVALFSATMPPAIRKLSKKYLTDAVEITVQARTKTAAGVRQRAMIVAYQQKLDALTRILETEDFDAMIVFARTKTETEMLADKLRARGFNTMALNGDVPQAQRERTVAALKERKLDILVATDVAARGLDVERISHVINYDIPTDPEAYVHRVGRTGRAGRTGDSISFVTPRERRLLALIEKTTRQPMELVPVPSVADVNSSRVARFRDAITEALGSEDLASYRELITAYENETNTPATDVAAALALMAQDGRPLLMERAEPARQSDRPARDTQDSAPERATTSRKQRATTPLARYRIAVGKRQQADPRMIVGALANEGGLRREDFGKIEIRPDHSIVELPARLPSEAWKRLQHTRISGHLIELTPDRAGGQNKKPRHKGPRPTDH